MAKAKSVFFCQNCGAESSKWMGRCPQCGEWNTLVEEIIKEICVEINKIVIFVLDYFLSDYEIGCSIPLQ